MHLPAIYVCLEGSELMNSIEEFNEHVLSEEAVTSIVDMPCHQTVSKNLVYYLLTQLYTKLPLFDRDRLLSVSSLYDAACMALFSSCSQFQSLFLISSSLTLVSRHG